MDTKQLYRYEAYSSDGKRRKGTVSFSSRQDALTHLHQKGLVITELAPAHNPAALSKKFIPRRLPLREQIFLLHQLSSLLACGITLNTALHMAGTTAADGFLAKTLKQVQQNLARGMSAHQAFRNHEPYFGHMLPFMVEIGESTGTLEEMLRRSAHILEGNLALRQSIGEAVRYPILVFVSLLGAFIFAMTAIIPRFAAIFAQTQMPLPLLTRILLDTSTFITTYWLLIVPTVSAATGGLIWWARLGSNRYILLRTGLRFPLLGPIMQISMLSHLFTTLQIMLQGGIPLASAIDATRHATRNPLLRVELRHMEELLSRGTTFHTALEASSLATPLAVQLARTGEESGTLDVLLEKGANYYDQQARKKLRVLAGYLEPLLLFLVGILVLILALGILLPMWQMTRM